MVGHGKIFSVYRPTKGKNAEDGGVRITGVKSFIGRNASFDTLRPELITIGEHMHIASGCVILTHFIDATKSDGTWYEFGPVTLEKDCFLGINTIICNSVTIGENSIVGAGSIVTKDIPAHEIWAGNPARFIRKR